MLKTPTSMSFLTYLFPKIIILFAGQTVVAASQIFILGIPAQLAATWFPPHQMSTATSIGVFGNQLGIALGFVLPAQLVPDQNDDNLSLIGHDLFVMFMGNKK